MAQNDKQVGGVLSRGEGLIDLINKLQIAFVIFTDNVVVIVVVT